MEPFLESIRLFASLYKKDDKGIASCLGLLTKCLGKLTLEEFGEVQQRFPDYFKKDHPCLESYVQGMEAVKYIQSLHESLYSSRHLVLRCILNLLYCILRFTHFNIWFNYLYTSFYSFELLVQKIYILV